MQNSERGVVLFEVMIAIVVLAIAAVSVATFAHETIATLYQVRQDEEKAVRASAFFEAVTLWSANEFDQRLGSRHQGEWRLDIQRSELTIYELVLRDSLDVEILRTAVYRPYRP